MLEVGYVSTMTSTTDSSPIRADALVMFGLTGDLGEKKLFPALYELAAAGRLGVPVIGAGRTEYTDSDLRDMLASALDDHRPTGGGPVDPDTVASIDLSYLAADSTDAGTYDALVDRLGGAVQPVVYAALPPGIFGAVARGIADSTLPDTTRLVTEKPFGQSAESARTLHEEIVQALDPARLLIVDHFLAKAAIENMLTVRTSNALVQNSMCARHVESIDIVMSESGGVDGRGSFYESVGAIDDVLQNHLLQMLATLTMERPADDSAEALRAARSELLDAVVPFDPASAVVGQYRGYRDLDDVDDGSDVETFVAVRTTVENERWSGVPVSIRTGKCLREDVTSATMTLTPPSPGGVDRAGWVPNRIHFTVKPDTSITFDLGVLDPESHRPVPTTVEVCGPVDHGRLGDYAVMLDNAMSGDPRHFAHIDDVVASWRIVDPLNAAVLDLLPYEPGTDGPVGGAP
jgi:glucose-6-phosphate 1-dehydrogenase